MPRLLIISLFDLSSLEIRPQLEAPAQSSTRQSELIRASRPGSGQKTICVFPRQSAAQSRTRQSELIMHHDRIRPKTICVFPRQSAAQSCARQSELITASRPGSGQKLSAFFGVNLRLNPAVASRNSSGHHDSDQAKKLSAFFRVNLRPLSVVVKRQAFELRLHAEVHQ